MSLKVYHEEETVSVITIPVDYQQQAKELFAALVDEAKTAGTDANDRPEDESAMAKARFRLRQFNNVISQKMGVKDLSAGKSIFEASSELQSAIIVLAMSTVVKNRHDDFIADYLCHDLLKSLLRRKIDHPPRAIEQMLKLVLIDMMTGVQLPLASLITNVERHLGSHAATKSIINSLEKLATEFPKNASNAAERKLGIRIDTMISESKNFDNSGPATESKPKVSPVADLQSRGFEFNTGEAWTNALLVELGQLSNDERALWHKLFDHCGTATASKPAKKWLRRAAELLAPIGPEKFAAVVGPALVAVGQPGECEKVDYGGMIQYREPTQIHNKHADMLRGLAWTTSLVDDPQLISQVGDAAEKCFQKIREVGPRCSKVGNACLIALSTLASVPAVGQLSRLKSRAKHVSTRKQIARAYERAARNAGMSESDLIELGVPSFDLIEPGVYRESFGDFSAELFVHPTKKPTLTWQKRDGKRQKTVPAVVKTEFAQSLKSLKQKSKEIEKLMPSIRGRLEQLFMCDRSWKLSDFRTRFLDHPVVAVVARSLIWNFSLADGAFVNGIWSGNGFSDIDGKPLNQIDETSIVKIWHPMHSSADDVLRWRNRLTDLKIVQPFKQAHREIYILTDAERQTSTYSNRFAAHIIRQHQFAALCQQREWRFDLQADWDSWNAPYLDILPHGMRVEFIVEPMEDLNETTEAFIYTHLATDQVRFLKLDEDGSCRIDSPVKLEEVPRLVFSEIMRDIDLFIGVTSIGNEPNQEPTHFDYWETFSFGELSQLALTRKQTLEQILPRLAIANRCRIEGKFLHVAGNIRNYKIHIGSGNILMSPNDQYLCIVQKRGSGAKRTDNIFLPFEGDNTLSLILSKAFMLADDDKIKDATIFNQIRTD